MAANKTDAVVISEGDRAPFSGVLVRREVIVDLLVQLEACREQSVADLRDCQTRCDIEARAAESVRGAEALAQKQSLDRCESDLEKQRKLVLDRAKLPWWHYAVSGLAGAAIGAGACAIGGK